MLSLLKPANHRIPFVSGPMYSKCLLLAFLCASLCFPACRTPKRASAVPKSAAIDDRIAPGDVLKITFSGASNLDQTQKVRSDGKLTLPTVGELTVAKKTPAALGRQLTEAYKATLQNSEVTVTMESSTAQVYVTGAVNRPGKIPFDRPMSLLEAIMEAGGFAKGLADPKRVQIIRQIDGSHQTFIVDLRPVLNGKTTEAVPVQKSDMIVVPETWL